MKAEPEFKKDINRDRVCLLLKIGLIGALMNLMGDMLMGWSVRDTSLKGIEGMVSQYLTMPDSRMFWSAMLGLIGAPVSVLGHLGIYKLIRPYSGDMPSCLVWGCLLFWF